MSIDIDSVKKVHFIGIGGIGMSALAQFFVLEDKEVSGSDRDPSPVIRSILERKGVSIKIGHNSSNVTKDIDLVVFSDAVVEGSEGYVERTYAEQNSIPTLSYFEVLGKLSKDRFTIAVAGTHGKTTTTGMLAKILIDTEINPTVIVGSVIKDFESNFVKGKKDPFVVEACEYKDHILKLHPNMLVINNLELDHTDYFKDLSEVQDTFRKAIESLPEGGILITNPSDPNIAPILEGVTCTIVDYAKELIEPLGLPGEHNEMNAKAAKAAAKAYAPSLSDISIGVSLEMYQGSWRRFEYIGETSKGAVVYDDYAHHPTAIEKTIGVFRDKFPDKELTVVFHPHLYSRTKSFFNRFAQALSLADHVVIAPIYAAREKPDPEISSDRLAEKTHPQNGEAISLGFFEEIEKHLRESCGKGDIIVTMGAGDIYKVAEAITQ